MRILLVDDDNALMESLAERLIQQRYAVDIAVDGDTAHTYVDLFNYDLIVLDLMLPDGDGIEFCQQFRQMGYGNPLMILTAKESTQQKVKALDAGADDYVVKPFDFDELCARIRALLRREHQGLPTVLCWGTLKLDPSTCETTYHDTPIRLTPKEFSLMELFLRNPNRIYSLSAIIDDLWSFEAPPGEDAVRTHIKGLRRKLKAAGAPKDLIKTVYGLGYRLNDSAKQSDPQDSDSKQKKTTAPKETISSNSVESLVKENGEEKSLEATPSKAAVAANMQEQLAQACRRYLRTASQQIAALEKAAIQFVAAAKTQTAIDPELYQESYTNAHKLAGSLGSYGIPQGSKSARKVEHALQKLSFPFAISTGSAAQISDWIKQLRHHVDSATIQSVVELTSLSLQESTPLVVVVSSENHFIQQMEEIIFANRLRMAVVSSPVQALDLFATHADRLAIAPPDLVLIDIGNEIAAKETASHTADKHNSILRLVKTIKQSGQTPIMVLGEQIELGWRLQLVKQGVEVVTDRTLEPEKIMTIVAELVTAKNSQVRIAFADDEPQALSLVKNILAPWGFQVETFVNAENLWHWLNNSQSFGNSNISPEDPENRHTVDIIVLDIEMPDVNGIELCQVIRADSRFQSVPILFLSQYQEDALRIQAFQSGADDFISKAIAPTELATRVCNQLTRACRLQPTKELSTLN